GFNETEAVGQFVDELLSPTDSNGNRCCIGASPHPDLHIIKGLPEQEICVKSKLGNDVWVGLTTSFERDGERRAFVVARDIAKRKRIDLAKSEVISAVSHELRSPLTSVKGFTSTLLNKWDRFDDETKKHLLTTINSDADRVTRLIGELLDISRLEAGRLELHRQMVSLPTIAAKVIDRVGMRAENHSLHNDIAGDFPDVFADPDKVEQVLTNLVENAVKYTPKGSVTLTASDQGDRIEIAVTDEGVGIPEEQKQQIFIKFFRRGAAVRADNPTGTGLGLYISKGLVEAHGGTLWVEDAEGKGSSFRFTIPRTEPAA
ncbi:MAG: ATP-binding protein, partial [Actinomycetota bacterium]